MKKNQKKSLIITGIISASVLIIGLVLFTNPSFLKTTVFNQEECSGEGCNGGCASLEIPDIENSEAVANLPDEIPPLYPSVSSTTTTPPSSTTPSSSETTTPSLINNTNSPTPTFSQPATLFNLVPLIKEALAIEISEYIKLTPNEYSEVALDISKIHCNIAPGIIQKAHIKGVFKLDSTAPELTDITSKALAEEMIEFVWRKDELPPGGKVWKIQKKTSELKKLMLAIQDIFAAEARANPSKYKTFDTSTVLGGLVKEEDQVTRVKKIRSPYNAELFVTRLWGDVTWRRDGTTNEIKILDPRPGNALPFLTPLYIKQIDGKEKVYIINNFQASQLRIHNMTPAEVNLINTERRKKNGNELNPDNHDQNKALCYTATDGVDDICTVDIFMGWAPPHE